MIEFILLLLLFVDRIFSEDTVISVNSSGYKLQMVGSMPERRLFDIQSTISMDIYSKAYLCSELYVSMYPFSCNKRLKVLLIPQYSLFPTQQVI
jgi:hypothetical protein